MTIRFPRTYWMTAVIALAFSGAVSAQQSDPIEFEKVAVAPAITVLVGQGGNVAVSAGKDGVYIIDDKVKAVSKELLAAVREVSDMPIRFVINTHYHGDHMGTNETFDGEGAYIIAHDNVHLRLSTKQYNSFSKSYTPPWPDAALPEITYNDTLTLHFNGDTAVLYHVPHGHTDGDSIVHFQDSNVIHMGDNFFNGMYPYIDLGGGGSVQGMIAAARLAASLADEDTRIIPGHGPVTDKAGLTANLEFLEAARHEVQNLVDQGLTLAETIAAQPTAQWDETLGGAFIKPHYLVMFIYNSLKGIKEPTDLP